LKQNQNTNEPLQPPENIPVKTPESSGSTTPATTPATKEQTLALPEQQSNIEQQTAEMEVHKHPHHVMHKKKWNEYLLEFFMLFLAVFLGFVAENIRENIVEHEREKQYMESFITDLQNDTATLIAGFRLKDQRIEAIDSVFLFFETHHDVKSVPRVVFRYMYRTI